MTTYLLNKVNKFAGTGLTFELNGIPYASGSTISVDDIGEGNNALICHTTRTDCCNGVNRNGEFFYPNNVEVGIFSAGTGTEEYS